jgi:nucleotide-binding universal stress UspA family protein
MSPRIEYKCYVSLASPRPVNCRPDSLQRAGTSDMYQKILVPIDGSTTSQKGLCEAIKLAKNQGAQLRLFHIVSEPILDCGYAGGTYGGELIASARKEGHEIVSTAESLARLEGLQPTSVMVESMGDSAAVLILEQANEWPADLIVMGTHGRHGLVRLMMGSDAESVAREAPVPVLLVHDVALNEHPVLREELASAPAAQVVYA